MYLNDYFCFLYFNEPNFVSCVRTTENPSKNTISTATLTIDKVLAKDFQAEFKCIGNTFYMMKNVTLTLKRGGQWQDCRLLSNLLTIWKMLTITSQANDTYAHIQILFILFLCFLSRINNSTSHQTCVRVALLCDCCCAGQVLCYRPHSLLQDFLPCT